MYISFLVGYNNLSVWLFVDPITVSYFMIGFVPKTEFYHSAHAARDMNARAICREYAAGFVFVLFWAAIIGHIDFFSFFDYKTC